MRARQGKEYGYIILPIGMPSDLTPEEALQDNKKYKVVWQVLQALRAHDDRFNAMINKIELTKRPPSSRSASSASWRRTGGTAAGGQPAGLRVPPARGVA